jgi:hypothetical protein
MKPKYFIIAIFWLVGFGTYSTMNAQHVRLSPMAEVFEMGGARGMGFGLRAEIFVSPAISLDYQYLFGVNTQGNFYTYYPGAMAGALMLSTQYYANPWSVNQWYYQGTDGLLALALLIPEGISIHLHPHERIELAPFLAPLGAGFNVRNNERSSLTATLGLRAHFKPVSFLSLSPHLGMRALYSTGEVGLVYGFGIGFSF